MIIAVDFDGTIVDDKYPKIGKLRENAIEVLKKLKEEGHYIIYGLVEMDVNLKKQFYS